VRKRVIVSLVQPDFGFLMRAPVGLVQPVARLAAETGSLRRLDETITNAPWPSS
jgi:hypothetical protein